MEVFNIQFQIYAENENEVAELRQAIVWFIELQRSNGRAVTAKKVSDAIKKWNKNPFVRNEINNYFK